MCVLVISLRLIVSAAWRWLLCGLVAFCLVGSPSAAPEKTAVVRIGSLTYSPPWYDGAFVDETIAWLRCRSMTSR